MKKIYFVIIILVIVVAAALFLTRNKTGNNGGAAPSLQMPVPGRESVPETAANPASAEIAYTDAGFSPSSLTIKKGGTVRFVNGSSNPFWPASAVHPTHKIYPGSDIEKCGTAEESKIFDACRGISPGGSWSYTFNETGSWNYHDHLNAKNFGKIIVQ